MKPKRIICILLLLSIMALTPLIAASCGGTENKDEPSQTTAAPDQQSQPSGEQATQAEFAPPPGVDYGGYEFTILGYDGAAEGTWQIAAISEIIAEVDSGEPINDALYRRNTEVEELYNITFGIVPITYPNRGDFATKFTRAVLSGDDMFDAAFLLGDSLPASLSKNNMACDLQTIPSLDLSMSWWDQNSIKGMSIGGKVNAVIGDVNLYSATAPLAIFANKKIMQDNDVGDLYEMVREGKWTWDVLYGIAKNVTKDINGDGIIDKNDQIGLFGQYLHLQTAIMSAGEIMTPKDSADIPVLSPNFERIAAIVSKVGPILKDRAASIIADDITAGYNNVFFDFILPKFRDDEIMFHVNQLLFSFELRNMDADFAILPFPKYDETQSGYGAMLANAWATYTVIPITCTDTERAANILQAMGYYSQKYVTPAYYDVTVTNKLIRDDGSAEMLDIIMKNRVFDLSYLYNWGDINGMLGTISSSGKSDTFLSQFEKNEGKIDTAIQKTLDQLQED
ncbi:MAG: extracellular solute-binding protein [Oscillospiraceae bacterium]|nr:extracellular solute-binding protein [Oscillospiraceae bacterium]